MLKMCPAHYRARGPFPCREASLRESPRRESNLHLSLRTGLLYPLSYGGIVALYHEALHGRMWGMDPNIQDAIRETLRLTRENNQMLHHMRRNAFLGSVIKFIIYAAFLLVPIWFYMTYMSSSVNALLADYGKLQGATGATQTQFVNLQKTIKDIESHLPSFMQTPSATTTP